MENAVAFRDKQVDRIIAEAIGPHSRLNPVQHSIFHKVVEYIEYTEKGFSVAELIPSLEAMIEGSAFLSVVSSGASILSIVLFPVNALLEILDAYEACLKMYGMRSIAYTITAWAFNRPIPVESRQYIANRDPRLPCGRYKGFGGIQEEME